MTGNGRELGGSFLPGPWRVRRAGYGAMQLAGGGVFGPPRDRYVAPRVLGGAAAASRLTWLDPTKSSPVHDRRHASVARRFTGGLGHRNQVVSAGLSIRQPDSLPVSRL